MIEPDSKLRECFQALLEAYGKCDQDVAWAFFLLGVEYATERLRGTPSDH